MKLSDYKKDFNGFFKQMTLGYLVRGDEVLMAMKKRGFGVGKWNGTGGKLQPGETVEEAMIREAGGGIRH
jgi:8-oxo-dGTP pyrophosphatase MutT (NUDIX family)